MPSERCSWCALMPFLRRMAGGSSDGAAALLLTNQLAGNAVPRHELLQFAARLGSGDGASAARERAMAWCAALGKTAVQAPLVPVAVGASGAALRPAARR